MGHVCVRRLASGSPPLVLTRPPSRAVKSSRVPLQGASHTGYERVFLANPPGGEENETFAWCDSARKLAKRSLDDFVSCNGEVPRHGRSPSPVLRPGDHPMRIKSRKRVSRSRLDVGVSTRSVIIVNLKARIICW